MRNIAGAIRNIARRCYACVEACYARVIGTRNRFAVEKTRISRLCFACYACYAFFGWRGRKVGLPGIVQAFGGIAPCEGAATDTDHFRFDAVLAQPGCEATVIERAAFEIVPRCFRQRMEQL